MKCFQPSSTFLNLEPYPLKVSQNLGLQHISHEEVIGKHTKPVAQTLFGDTGNLQVAILVLDGTYTYRKLYYTCICEQQNKSWLRDKDPKERKL